MKFMNIFGQFGILSRKVLELSSEIKILSFLTVFLSPLLDFMGILILLLVVDILTSVWNQYKVKLRRCRDKVESTHSEKYRTYRLKLIWRILSPEKLLTTIEKIISYGVALLVTFTLDYYVLRIEDVDGTGRFYTLSISNAVFIIILVSEAISILRNLGGITGNAVFSQIVKTLIKKTNYETSNNQPNLPKR